MMYRVWVLNPTIEQGQMTAEDYDMKARSHKFPIGTQAYERQSLFHLNANSEADALELVSQSYGPYLKGTLLIAELVVCAYEVGPTKLEVHT